MLNLSLGLRIDEPNRRSTTGRRWSVPLPPENGVRRVRASTPARKSEYSLSALTEAWAHTAPTSASRAGHQSTRPVRQTAAPAPVATQASGRSRNGTRSGPRRSDGCFMPSRIAQHPGGLSMAGDTPVLESTVGQSSPSSARRHSAAHRPQPMEDHLLPLAPDCRRKGREGLGAIYPRVASPLLYRTTVILSVNNLPQHSVQPLVGPATRPAPGRRAQGRTAPRRAPSTRRR